MALAELDSKGRLTIPKPVREQLGMTKRVLVLNVGSHLKVIPLPADPFRVLEGAFSVRKSFAQLRKQAEAQARREAGQ
jgi:bifunctional DNA-binding transcriptional regulator/antitoxin component of YhaV-PrlF toxin-antitoxin module